MKRNLKIKFPKYFYHDGEYFDWFITNPLKTYNKTDKKRKLIRHIQFGEWYKLGGPPCSLNNCAKILNICAFDVGWKDKYDTPRFETDPVISITIFKKWQFLIFWRYSDNYMENDLIWESILNKLYYENNNNK